MAGRYRRRLQGRAGSPHGQLHPVHPHRRWCHRRARGAHPTDRAHDAAGADWDNAVEECELLSADGGDYDQEAFLAGEATPVLFTSAALNFGVNQLLDNLVRLAPPPSGQLDVDGNLRPVDSRSARSCSRSRRAWTLRTATASPTRGSARAPSSAATCSPTPPPESRSSPSTRNRCSANSAQPWTMRGQEM